MVSAANNTAAGDTLVLDMRQTRMETNGKQNLSPNSNSKGKMEDMHPRTLRVCLVGWANPEIPTSS
jgi:hypothetical protein